MKCIKNLETSEIKRVDDVIAYSRVGSGDYSYVPKSEWKTIKIGIDKKVREKFPANVEGSPEFKEAAVAQKKEHVKKKDRVAKEKSKSSKKK